MKKQSGMSGAVDLGYFCVERVFAVASSMLHSDQHQQLEDAASSTVMLRYNKRKPCSDDAVGIVTN